MVGDRLDRDAGGDQRPAVAPAQQVGRRRLDPLGRVGDREDDRPLDPRRHRAYDPLGERAVRGGGAQQHGRFDPLDDLGQRDAAAVP